MKTKSVFKVIDVTTGEIFEIYGGHRSLYHRLIRDVLKSFDGITEAFPIKCTFKHHECRINWVY